MVNDSHYPVFFFPWSSAYTNKLVAHISASLKNAQDREEKKFNNLSDRDGHKPYPAWIYVVWEDPEEPKYAKTQADVADWWILWIWDERGLWAAPLSWASVCNNKIGRKLLTSTGTRWSLILTILQSVGTLAESYLEQILEKTKMRRIIKLFSFTFMTQMESYVSHTVV